MTISVNKTDFLSGIKAIKSSCGKMNLQPILGTIHVKTIGQGLQLTASDLENSARTVVEANVTGDYNFCVNADKLESIVNALNDIITIDLPDNVAIIKSGKTEFSLLTLNADEYPEPDFTLPEDKIILSHNDFINGVNKTVFATAQETQNILAGVCFTFNKENGYEMAATDGNRLSRVIFDGVSVNCDGQYVIPNNILINVSKNIGDEVEIYFKGSKIIFKTKNYLYSSNLYSGQFPKYAQLIPTDSPLKAVVKRNDLLHSLEKVAIMVDNRSNLTTFNFKDNQLNLTTKTVDVGTAKDSFDITFGGEIVIGFNYRFVLEAIKAMDTDEIVICMNKPTSACLIQGDFTCLIMPVQIRG